MKFEEVLEFWFEEISPKQWWQKDEAFDQLIRMRFAELHASCHAGECAHWRMHEGRVNDAGRLAEIIVLDQFPRNIYRDTPRAFASDGIALILAQEAVNAGCAERLSQQQSGFLLMPYMHSESRVVHEDAERLFAEFGSAAQLDFERRHKAIIDEFGRYPHRNEIMGRESSAAEIAFLQKPGSSF